MKAISRDMTIGQQQHSMNDMTKTIFATFTYEAQNCLRLNLAVESYINTNEANGFCVKDIVSHPLTIPPSDSLSRASVVVCVTMTKETVTNIQKC